MTNYASKVIKIAKAEENYLEKSEDAYKKNPKVLDKKTDGAGSDNYTKYGRDMHKIYPSVMDFPAAWCDCFVDWCFQKAYGISNAKKLLAGNFDDYTVNSANLYKKKNAWHTKNPEPGDQIFFSDSNGGICHTGIVTKVENGNVFTIEGNTSSGSTVVSNGGCVREKKYPESYKRIAGYGRPAYDRKEKKAKEDCSVLAKVKASSLFVRNCNGKKIGSIPKGKVVEVIEKNATKMTINGTLYTMSKIKHGLKIGYVAKKYLEF